MWHYREEHQLAIGFVSQRCSPKVHQKIHQLAILQLQQTPKDNNSEALKATLWPFSIIGPDSSLKFCWVSYNICEESLFAQGNSAKYCQRKFYYALT